MHISSAATKAFTRGLIFRSPLKQCSLRYNTHHGQSSNKAFANRNLTNAIHDGSCRLMSSNSGSNKGSGGTKLIVFGGVAALSLVGGTIGYAGVDQEFRAYVEAMIPGAKEAFEAIIGNTESSGKTTKPQKTKIPEHANEILKVQKKPTEPALESAPPSKLKQITIDAIVEPETKSSESTSVISTPLDIHDTVTTSSVEVDPEPPATPPLPTTSYFPPSFEQVAPKSTTSNNQDDKKSVSDEENKTKGELKSPEVVSNASPDIGSIEIAEVGKKEIAATEQHTVVEKEEAILEIESLVSTMSGLTDAAEKAGILCQEAIKHHSVLVEKVLEKAVGDDNDADDGTWKNVFEAANKKADHLGKAQSQIKEAKSGIKRALEAVERAKASEDLKIATNPIVSNSDELVNEALLKVQSVVQRLETATNDSRLVEEYRDLVEEGRQQFRREIAALLPDTSPDGISVREGPLSDDELDVFVTHAYRKVCRLQQELAKQTTIAQQRLESSVTDEQLRKQVVTEEVVQAELEAQRRLLEVEHQRKMAAIREEMENEVRSQLRRQAAAHSDHVKDAVEVEASELRRKHNHEMEDKISNERSAHQKELSSLTGRIDGIKMVVRQRADLELRIHEAQELWLACKALSLALCGSTLPDGILPSIQTEFNAVEKAANKVTSVAAEVSGVVSGVPLETNDFVPTVLNSIPKEALSRGIYTEKTLRDRFFRVENIAKRTAFVKENSSLLMYLLSYIQSFVMVSPSTEKMPDSDIDLDIDSLSNYDAITLAKGCVERGDIAQAVRYLTLLKGESANVSKDWIKEARLLLETQQACDALLAHAASIGLETFPRRPNATEKQCCHSKN